MPRITALETQQRHAERVNVFLDGEFAFGLAVITAQQAGLHIGGELSQAEIDALLGEDLFQKALARALVLLGYRPRSESEVRQRLVRAKFEPELIERVVEKLRAERYLDDREFARFWTENRTSFNPRGGRLISLELRQKGVERGAIEEALEEGLDEEAAAFAAARKKLRQPLQSRLPRVPQAFGRLPRPPRLQLRYQQNGRQSPLAREPGRTPRRVSRGRVGRRSNAPRRTVEGHYLSRGVGAYWGFLPRPTSFRYWRPAWTIRPVALGTRYCTPCFDQLLAALDAA